MLRTFWKKGIRRTRLWVLGLLVLGSLGLTGCATMLPAPPPQPRSALVSPPGHLKKKPHPHARWVKGHYVYRSGRYVWTPGHWKR